VQTPSSSSFQRLFIWSRAGLHVLTRTGQESNHPCYQKNDGFVAVLLRKTLPYASPHWGVTRVCTLALPPLLRLTRNCDAFSKRLKESIRDTTLFSGGLLVARLRGKGQATDLYVFLVQPFHVFRLRCTACFPFGISCFEGSQWMSILPQFGGRRHTVRWVLQELEGWRCKRMTC